MRDEDMQLGSIARSDASGSGDVHAGVADCRGDLG
jgi:hypothetical protein